MQNIFSLARYSLDMAILGPSLSESLRHSGASTAAVDDILSDKKSAHAGFGILGPAYLDAIDSESRYEHLRDFVGSLAERIFLLADAVQARLQDQSTNIFENHFFIQNLEVALMTGREFATDDPRERAASALAASLHHGLMRIDTRGIFRLEFKKMTALLHQQTLAQSPAERVDLIGDLGAACSEAVVGALEAFTSRDFPQLRIVAREMGACLWFDEQAHAVEAAIRKFASQHSNGNGNGAPTELSRQSELHAALLERADRAWYSVESLLSDDTHAFENYNSLKTLLRARRRCRDFTQSISQFRKSIGGSMSQERDGER